MREHDWAAPAPGVERLLTGVDLGQLASAAAYHGVTGCVYRSLSQVESVPPAVADAIEGRYEWSLQTHLRALGDLAHLAPVLDAAGVPWVVLKGPVLSEVFYPHPDLRSYTDVDLYLCGGELGVVLDALAGAGGRLLDLNWPRLRRLLTAELHYQLRWGTLADLHWHLLHEPETRRAFSIRIGEVFARGIQVDLGEVKVPSFEIHDTFVHLCLHACLAGLDRLVWLKDIDAVARAQPDWDEVALRARAWGAGPAVAAVVRQARRVLDAPVPAWLVERSASSGAWRVVEAAAQVVSPLERSSGQRSVAKLVARSIRRDARSSFAELARRALAQARSGFSGRFPPDAPALTQLHIGDERDRAAFLAAVALETLAVESFDARKKIRGRCRSGRQSFV